MNPNPESTIEVELKFAVSDHAPLIEELLRLGAIESKVEKHRDTYFRHPCRDFSQTREALRIRRITLEWHVLAAFMIRDEVAHITYKGPHLAGGIKAREELEWSLHPSDSNGGNQQQLLIQLGFEVVATVTKRRRSFALMIEDRELTIACDQVDDVGTYAEVETLTTLQNVDLARSAISLLANQLGLTNPEPRSYLRLLLSRSS